MKTDPSTIHGTGVFAVRDFVADDVILTRDESRLVDDEHPLREEMGEHEWHCDWLENGRQVLLPSPERHVNHSCEANTWTDFSRGAGRITALKTIQAGEELTCSYSVNLAGGARGYAIADRPVASKLFQGTSLSFRRNARSN